ncbi:MAG TPA: Xaa-Pro peptidase family protein [Actinomycetota bacterium]|nr:Xaa-Pro peptidase family protein [Actinomycetota bacterium]
MDHEGRISRLQRDLTSGDVDPLLVTNLTNVRYLTGFSGTNGQVLVHADGALFLTDPRYEARAGALVQGADVLVYPARLTDVLGDQLTARKVTRLGVEGSMTLTERDDLVESVDAELVTVGGTVESLRRNKDAEEIELIRDAVRLGDETFAWVLDRLVPGVSERAIALDVEMHMRQHGADGVAFPPIVASGPLSAHIHHTPGDRTFDKGDLVLVDFGCTRDGYCSDLSRTVVLGPATDEQQELYALVLQAHNAGISAVAAGRTGVEVDKAGRDVISAAGHAERFGHGLGHGVGLDVHEAPRLHRISEDTLESGDVVTVEPGVYIPDDAGIRIEDCVLVTESGGEVLGFAPKDRLIEL